MGSGRVYRDSGILAKHLKGYGIVFFFFKYLIFKGDGNPDDYYALYERS